MKKLIGIGSRLLLCFVSGVFLFFAFIGAIFYFRLSENSLLAELDQVSFAEKMSSVVEEELTNIAIPSGLPENFFEGKVAENDLQAIAVECIRSYYEGTSFSPDLSALKDTIREEIWEYAKSNEKETDEEALDSLAAQVVDVYRKYSASSLFRYLSGYAPTVRKYAGIASLSSFVISVILMGLILWTAKRKYLSFCAGTCGMMLLIVPSIFRIMQVIEKVNITPFPVKHYLISFVNGALDVMIVAGAVLVLAAMANVIFPLQRTPRQNVMYVR